MLNLKDDIQQQVEEAAKECAEAYAKGAVPMLRLITKKTRKASVYTRVYYVLGGIQAMGAVDPIMLAKYFEDLWSRTPKDEEGEHVRAMEIVFNQLLVIITQQMTEKMQVMANAMRIDDEVEFYSMTEGDENDPLGALDNDTGDDPPDPKNLH